MGERKQANVGVWIFLSVLLMVVAFFIFANMAREDSKSNARTVQDQLNSCLLAAENSYNEDLKLNSTGSKLDESGKTVYTGNADTFDRLADEKQKSDSLCHQTYRAD